MWENALNNRLFSHCNFETSKTLKIMEKVMEIWNFKSPKEFDSWAFQPSFDNGNTLHLPLCLKCLVYALTLFATDSVCFFFMAGFAWLSNGLPNK